MSWKTQLQLRDIDPRVNRLEAICRVCQHIHYVSIEALLTANPHMQFIYIDELERDMVCHARHCRGHYRVALVHCHPTSAFVGGLA